MPHSTVKDTINNSKSRNQGESAPRSGRPKVYTDRDERAILRLVRLNPKWTYRRLVAELECKPSRSIVTRILKKYNITKWAAKKRPELREIHAHERLVWAKAHENWTEDDWLKIIWSDECLVERGAGKNRE